VTIVFDTNVLIAALVANGLCHEIVQRGLRLHALASSPALLDELERTLRNKVGMTPEARRFVDALRHHVRIVDPEPLPSAVSRDPDDDVVLSTALAAGADVIVTGDHDLLVLVSYEGIPILSPRQLLESLAD
jgi:putative PIN family toxin of toxin-antitoxin system